MDVNASVDIGTNITGLLEKLAVQLGTTADKVFPWYAQQQVIEGYTNLISILFFIILGLFFAITCWFKADFENGNRYTPFCTGGIFISFTSLIIFAGYSSEILNKIYNPNIFALKSIIHDLSGLLH